MKQLYLLCLALCCTLFVSAQSSYVHQIIFLNEGWYDFEHDTLAVPPSLGAYDPATDTYTVFDQIPEADFASDVIVDDVIYVAADNLLITYDKNTLQRLQMIPVPGIREMAVWNDQLLISRGDYLVKFDSYFQVYDKKTLEPLYALDTLTGPKYASDGILVRNDTAYLAINNGFDFGNEVGLIGVIDLQHRTYAGEIDLGPAGINPDNIMMDDDHIYTLNNKDFSSSSVSIIDPDTRVVSTHDMIAANSGCGTSTLADDHLYFMEYTVGKLARFDVHTLQVVDTLAETGAYYGLIDDQLSQRLIATWTDFVSSGTAYFLNYDGTVIKSFDVGISPGSIALDIRSVTAVDDVPANARIAVYPNPASDDVTVESDEPMLSVKLLSITGAVVASTRDNGLQTRFSLGQLPAGIYAVQTVLQSGQVDLQKISVQ